MHDPCPVCTPPPGPPPLAITSAAQALRDACPGYAVTLAWQPSGWRFHAVRRHDGPGPWCLISASPREICDALTARAGTR
jgi:hypothetical protein